jgi:Fe-S cluster biogenesis protein NfuA/nitrite reductase/ring-hydroxylating ferredoxin subunit
MMPDRQAQEHVRRVEALLDELEDVEPGPAKKKADDLVQALVDLYGEALTRIMARLPPSARSALLDDELLSHLLLVHDLHPQTLEQRVQAALEQTRPYLHSHGGEVELLGVRDGVVHLHLRGTCDGCPSASTTLRLAIEDAIRAAAPEVERIDAGEAVAAPMIPVASLTRRDRPAPEPGWEPAGRIDELPGHPVVREMGRSRVVLLRSDRDTYAYRDRCPGCEASLADASLHGDLLTCAHCRRRYDIRRAGACPDGGELHLDPLPLLTGPDQHLKVAVGGGP